MEKKKEICFLINNLSDSGGTQRVLTLLSGLLVANYGVTIFSVQKGAPFFQLHKEVDVCYKTKSNPFELYQLLKNRGIKTLVLLDSNATLLFGLLRPKNCRLIVWEHLSVRFIHRSVLSNFSRYLATLFSDSFVLLTNTEVQRWKERYSRLKKVYKIKNPVRNIRKEKRSLEEYYNRKCVLAIGNNINVKGFDTLVAAWNKVHVESWCLNVVGLSSSEMQPLKELCGNSDSIKLFGPVQDIDGYYNQSSLFCLSSRHEVLPTTLTEALFHHIPSVYFPCGGGLLEIVENSGGLVEQDSVEALSHTLSRAMTDFSYYKRLSQSQQCFAGVDEYNVKVVEAWNQIL